jgi:hypothetical protein
MGFAVREDRGNANRTKGHLDTYRFCDEVWTFLIKDVTFKMENSSQTVQADKVKIVSCNSKTAWRSSIAGPSTNVHSRSGIAVPSMLLQATISSCAMLRTFESRRIPHECGMMKLGFWEGMEWCSGWKAFIEVRNKTKDDFREIEAICLGGKIPQTAVNQNDDLTARSAVTRGWLAGRGATKP